jgi:hypothetical protein
MENYTAKLLRGERPAGMVYEEFITKEILDDK